MNEQHLAVWAVCDAEQHMLTTEPMTHLCLSLIFGLWMINSWNQEVMEEISSAEKEKKAEDFLTSNEISKMCKMCKIV